MSVTPIGAKPDQRAGQQPVDDDLQAHAARLRLDAAEIEGRDRRIARQARRAGAFDGGCGPAPGHRRGRRARAPPARSARRARSSRRSRGSPRASRTRSRPASATGPPTARRASAPSGSTSSARAMASIWRCPPESRPAVQAASAAQDRERSRTWRQIRSAAPRVRQDAARRASDCRRRVIERRRSRSAARTRGPRAIIAMRRHAGDVACRRTAPGRRSPGRGRRWP